MLAAVDACSFGMWARVTVAGNSAADERVLGENGVYVESIGSDGASFCLRTRAPVCLTPMRHFVSAAATTRSGDELNAMVRRIIIYGRRGE